MEYISNSAAETRSIGACLAGGLDAGAMVLLDGPLGAGKTAFAQGMAEALGVTEPVGSPTFAILCVYKGRVPFVHMDAYRIEDADDLESTGFFDHLDGRSIIVIEWGGRTAEMLPPDAIRVQICPLDGDRRIITIKGGPQCAY